MLELPGFDQRYAGDAPADPSDVEARVQQRTPEANGHHMLRHRPVPYQKVIVRPTHQRDELYERVFGHRETGARAHEDRALRVMQLLRLVVRVLTLGDDHAHPH